ncbi:MAG: low molecular weight protein-tyrosine-phosphatase [Pseudomonadota bacterium]|nr:low molecular weight protein-tyrosine-phosphatase [Pseudomonadota bacterium]
MAEGAFRSAAAQADLDCEIDSAGTASYHLGEAPDPRAIATAKANAVDIREAKGRQLESEDFERFSHIFALDTANLAGIRARQPKGARAKVALLLDAVPGRVGEPVADPYYGGEDDFDAVWQDVALAAQHLAERLKEDGVSAQF